ncbi:MAG: hypothetical protein M0P00_10945, partial [Bacteroidaceae bacterium]|nr:hypothetical protein [Bacteroidaceae bacterium]
SLTVYDLHCKLEKSCSEKIDKWCYASFIFPETHTVWCAYDGAENELDYLMFTYEVDDSDSVIVSEATPVKLTVSVAEINKIISEKDSVISLKDAEIVKKDNTLIKANEEIVGLKSEIATLEPYKVEHEQAEAARIEAKKEEKRNEIKIMLIKSKFFSEKDMESEQIKSLIAETDEVGVKSLISDRFMASLDANVKPETAEKQPTTIPKANISFDGDDFTVTKMLNMREHKN